MDYFGFVSIIGLLGLAVALAIPITIVSLGRRLGRWRGPMIIGGLLGLTPLGVQLIYWLDLLRPDYYGDFSGAYRAFLLSYAIAEVCSSVGLILILVGVVGMARDLHKLRMAAGNTTQTFSDFEVPIIDLGGPAVESSPPPDLTPPT